GFLPFRGSPSRVFEFEIKSVATSKSTSYTRKIWIELVDALIPSIFLERNQNQDFKIVQVNYGFREEDWTGWATATYEDQLDVSQTPAVCEELMLEVPRLETKQATQDDDPLTSLRLLTLPMQPPSATGNHWSGG
ncbi:345_t:CDS:2, partial [Acaulospora colombiana]